jgi:hypothetical protein
VLWPVVPTAGGPRYFDFPGGIHSNTANEALIISAGASSGETGKISAGYRTMTIEPHRALVTPQTATAAANTDVVITLWKTTTGACSGVFSSPSTTVTATAAAFHATMVGRTLKGGSGTEYLITAYTSTTVVVVTGDASAETTFTVTADPLNVLDYVHCSYFGAGTNSTGSLTVAVDGTTVLMNDLLSKDIFKFDRLGIVSGRNEDIVITLAAAGASVTGRLSVGSR